MRCVKTRDTRWRTASRQRDTCSWSRLSRILAHGRSGRSAFSSSWQGRRHGFLSGWGGGSNRRQGGQPTPKYLKNRKKHRVLATSFSNLGGRTTQFSKVRGSGPPRPPRRRRPCFLERSGITTEGKKKATFLTVCGRKTYSLVRSLISPQKPKDVSFDDLIKIIKEHQDPTPSGLVSRFKFGSCGRRAGQTIADYVAVLRKASEFCCFENALEDRLLEQLVIGVGDERMQRRLLSEKTLDFSNAVRICLALETSTKDAHLMSSNGERAEAVQAVRAD